MMLSCGGGALDDHFICISLTLVTGCDVVSRAESPPLSSVSPEMIDVTNNSD